MLVFYKFEQYLFAAVCFFCWTSLSALVWAGAQTKQQDWTPRMVLEAVIIGGILVTLSRSTGYLARFSRIQARKDQHLPEPHGLTLLNIR